MSHFLLFAIGDNVEEQLAIYNLNLQVEAFKERLYTGEILRVQQHYEVEDPDDIVNAITDWVGFEGGLDEDGYFFWSTKNPRGKFDWCVMGGRWSGYLKLKPGCSGDLGKRGAGIPDSEPLPYGELSADCALFGDVDWQGMRSALRVTAERVWHEALSQEDQGWPARYRYGIEPWMDKDSFLRERSHPGSYAVLKNSEWYERADAGWWGVLLDAEPVTIWHNKFDELISDCQPDTLVTVIDAHIQT